MPRFYLSTENFTLQICHLVRAQREINEAREKFDTVKAIRCAGYADAVFTFLHHAQETPGPEYVDLNVSNEAFNEWWLAMVAIRDDWIAAKDDRKAARLSGRLADHGAMMFGWVDPEIMRNANQNEVQKP